MEQYIPKSAVVAEIERRKDAALMRQQNLEAIGQETALNKMIVFELNRIISFIDSLEVKEVDLDAEIVKYEESFKHNPASMGYKETAKHFFELGLKAQKGEEL